MGSVPGWGTKIPHAVSCSQKINFGKKKDILQMQGGLIIIVVKITTTIIMQITETLSALGERTSWGKTAVLSHAEFSEVRSDLSRA